MLEREGESAKLNLFFFLNLSPFGALDITTLQNCPRRVSVTIDRDYHTHTDCCSSLSNSPTQEDLSSSSSVLHGMKACFTDKISNPAFLPTCPKPTLVICAGISPPSSKFHDSKAPHFYPPDLKCRGSQTPTVCGCFGRHVIVIN
jgi:hypothetical protein